MQSASLLPFSPTNLIPHSHTSFITSLTVPFFWVVFSFLLTLSGPASRDTSLWCCKAIAHPSLGHTAPAVRSGVESAGKDQKDPSGMEQPRPLLLAPTTLSLATPYSPINSKIVSSSGAILFSLCQHFSGSCIL